MPLTTAPTKSSSAPYPAKTTPHDVGPPHEGSSSDMPTRADSLSRSSVRAARTPRKPDLGGELVPRATGAVSGDDPLSASMASLRAVAPALSALSTGVFFGTSASL